MGSKRRIITVLLMTVVLVVGMSQGVWARPATKVNLQLKGTITSDSAIELSWKAFKGASFYLVYRAPVVDGYRAGRYKHVGTAYGTTYIDSNVGKDMTYRYFLRFGVGKRSFKSRVKDVHVGIDPPRFVMAKDGGDEYTSTDFDRITLVVEPGGGPLPDTIQLQRKNGKKYKTIQEKEYKPGKNGAVSKLTFVDKDVVAGQTYDYRIRSCKGKGKSGAKSSFKPIRMTALNQVGKYKVCWAPRTLNQDNTVVLCVDSQKYNYALVMDKKNRCLVTLAGGGNASTKPGDAFISHFSVDGRTWKKAASGYKIKEGKTYLAITGENVGMDTVRSIVLTGTYSGKKASISMKNLLKIFYLQNDENVEFYGKNT